MYVCKHCLMAIESHEGSQFSKDFEWDDLERADYLEDEEEGNIAVKCDWCEEMFDMAEMCVMI